MQQMWTDIDHYIDSHLIPNDPILTQTLKHTAERGFPDHLAVAPNQGMLLQMLIQMNKCKRILELGTFAAYSTLWLARALPEDTEAFDFIFIDADKQSYPEYLELSLNLSHSGTIIVLDNVIRSGAILDQNNVKPSIEGIRQMFEALSNHPRILSCTALQTVGSKGHDGFALAIVK